MDVNCLESVSLDAVAEMSMVGIHRWQRKYYSVFPSLDYLLPDFDSKQVFLASLNFNGER